MPDTIVNPQITDAVTQSNVKSTADTPAMAMSAIYQIAAQAFAQLYQNTVIDQRATQQLAQTALSRGVMQLLSLDLASDGGPQRVEAAMNDTVQELDARIPAQARAGNGVAEQIEDAVNFSQDKVFGAVGDFAYGQRACADAFAAALEQFGAAQHRDRLRVLQEAAIAVCLSAMLKSPEHSEAYAELLERIKRLV